MMGGCQWASMPAARLWPLSFVMYRQARDYRVADADD